MSSTNLAAGWAEVPIEQVATCRMGKTILSPELVADGLPVYSAGSSLEPWGYVRMSDVEFGEETIVISARGNIGQPKRPKCTRFVCTQTTIAASFDKKELVPYCFYFLKAYDFSRKTSQTTIPMLRVSDVNGIIVPVAPLNEQRRIVAKIEELFSELDKGIENLKQARAQLAVFRQALLKHAFEGKLTTGWRAAELGNLNPVDQLLKRIAGNREHDLERASVTWKQQMASWEVAQTGAKPVKPRPPKQTRPITPSEAGDAHAIPDTWKWVRLGEIARTSVGFAFESKHFADSGIRLLRGDNIEPGALRWTNARYWPAEDSESQWIGQLSPQV